MRWRSADIPVCGFTGFSNPVSLSDLGRGLESPRTRRLESLRHHWIRSQVQVIDRKNEVIRMQNPV